MINSCIFMIYVIFIKDTGLKKKVLINKRRKGSAITCFTPLQPTLRIIPIKKRSITNLHSGYITDLSPTPWMV